MDTIIENHEGDLINLARVDRIGIDKYKDGWAAEAIFDSNGYRKLTATTSEEEARKSVAKIKDALHMGHGPVIAYERYAPPTNH